MKFPECACSYESGYSLDRWCNKKPRLKHKTTHLKKIIHSDLPVTSCSTNETPKDESESFENDEQDDTVSDNEVNSDIEELFRRSQRFEETVDEDYEKRKKSKSHRHSKKKRKSKRTIRYSWSKPVSPETEQIIRVDVTSCITIEDMYECTKRGKKYSVHLFSFIN